MWLRMVLNSIIHLYFLTAEIIDMPSCPTVSGFLIFSYFIWVFYVHICLCTMYVSSACTGWEEDIRSPRTGVQMVVICHGGARNWTWILWKSSKSFQPLSHLSSHILLSERKHKYTQTCSCIKFTHRERAVYLWTQTILDQKYLKQRKHRGTG